MHSPAAPLPSPPKRVLVAGVSGAGKTTLARRIAALTGGPYTEIDALSHGPAWTPRPEFPAGVDTMVRGDAWTTEWQYDAARRVLAGSADLLAWLDFPLVRGCVRHRKLRDGCPGRWPARPAHTRLTDEATRQPVQMNADIRLDSVRLTYDAVADSYAGLLPDASFEAPTDRGMIEAFVRHLTEGPARPVVDAGCGTGRMTRLLASLGVAISGIDVSAGMIAVARRTSPELAGARL